MSTLTCNFCNNHSKYQVSDDETAVSLCEDCTQQTMSEINEGLKVHPLEPQCQCAYDTLEQLPDEGSAFTSAYAATLGERYGTPWPVSGDHLARAQIGRASCRQECSSQCRSRWSPYH